MAAPRSIVVAGGGLAATRTVERLRAHHIAGPITMVCAEPHVPYDRPPLSKEVLRGERDDTSLRVDWNDLELEFRTGCRAVAVHADERTVLLDDGAEIPFDALVIATGAEPHTVPSIYGSGAHVLRTIEDSRTLASDIRRDGQLAIVGGGFIGCEVAASARALGVEVTLVELLKAPLARVLGTQVAAEVADMHEAAGVHLLCGISVVEARGEGADRELLLFDGRTIEAPVVLASVGVHPATEWLDGSGIEVDDGVLCGPTGRTSVPGVWAAGDVARWEHPLYGAHIRLEHWTSAVEQAGAVARDIAGQPTPRLDVPYFWSDQYGVKFQMLGLPHPEDEVTLHRVGPAGDRMLALYGRDGRISGALGVSVPKWVMRMRPLLMQRASYADALAAAQA